jgi:hypothetical protein
MFCVEDIKNSGQNCFTNNEFTLLFDGRFFNRYIYVLGVEHFKI